MARAHGRILASIWEDGDFLALTQQQQRLYLFLISQPNLNHAGLLPATLRRWARKAAGLTAAELEGHLKVLDAAGFIVVDDDTEEILIRSFVRNDGVWKQPRVMGAMVSGAMEIESKALRLALLAEMDRIPLDELPDEPTKVRGVDGPSLRAQVREHITALRKAFGNPGPGPSGGGYGTPSAPPSGTPSDRGSATTSGNDDTHNSPAADTDTDVTSGNASHEPPADPLPEPPPEGGSEPPYARGRVRASRAHSPSPTPAPVPSPVQEGGACASGHQDNDPLAPVDRDGFELTDAMRRWALDTFGNTLDADYETQQFLDHHRAEGRHRKNWPAEWQKWMRRSAKWASERAQRSNVVALPASRPSTTDARVEQARAVGRRLQARADAARAQEN